MRKGLAIGGGATLGGLWLVSAVAATSAISDDGSFMSSAQDDPEDFGALYAPVVGPFIAIGTLEARNVGLFLLMLDGLGQAAGLSMMIAGLATTQPYLIRTGDLELSVSPLIGSTQGLGFTGRF